MRKSKPAKKPHQKGTRSYAAANKGKAKGKRCGGSYIHENYVCRSNPEHEKAYRNQKINRVAATKMKITASNISHKVAVNTIASSILRNSSPVPDKKAIAKSIRRHQKKPQNSATRTTIPVKPVKAVAVAMPPPVVKGWGKNPPLSKKTWGGAW
jgi:hypothetical protein